MGHEQCFLQNIVEPMPPYMIWESKIPCLLLGAVRQIRLRAEVSIARTRPIMLRQPSLKCPDILVAGRDTEPYDNEDEDKWHAERHIEYSTKSEKAEAATYR